MKKTAFAIVIFVLCVLGIKGNVSAAGEAEIAVKGEAFSEGTTEWSVTCELNSNTQVTNGKIRVTYDGSKLKLTSSGAGALLGGTMTEINDPVSGNKAEGEVVLAFASSGQMEAAGVLLNLNFQVLDTVRDGDEITISVKTEEMKSGSETVEVKDVPLVFAVGGSVRTPEENTESSQSEGGNTTQSDEESTGDSSAQSDDPTGTGNTSAQNSSNTGTGNTSAEQTEKSSGTVASAKTGDSTNLVLPATGAVAALLVLMGMFFWKRKSPRT